MTKFVLVGEAWGVQEETIKHPFVGPTGVELIRMLSEASIITLSPEDKANLQIYWFERESTPVKAAWALARIWSEHYSEIFPTNVFNLHPERNDLDTLCTDKAGDHLKLPALKAGKYVRSEFVGEIDRLFSELTAHAPTVVIALGATAAWALLHSSGITRIRGTVAEAVRGGWKVLPTYHPAAVLRQWDLRPVTVLDLGKARRESEYPEIRRPLRRVITEPSIRDMEGFFDEHLADASVISFDIETRGDQITCIGFASSTSLALVVPFSDNRKADGCYWPTLEEERRAWDWVRKVLDTPTPKIGQNGLYDITFLWKQYGIPVRNYEDDSMLLHHALQPESEKGLGFLGSVYTSEASWKLMRSRGKETIKRDE